jgi:histidinol-phosphate aminotransferase
LIPQIRPWAASASAYVPGRPAADDTGSMASNESALGPSAAVRDAIAGAAGSVARYPDPLATPLRERAGEHLGVDPGQILVGNGSDELITLLVHAYASFGGSVVVADPPYRLHALTPELQGATVRAIPLRDWTHDLDRMAGIRADLAFVCNPHNPTGTAVDVARLASFTEQFTGLTVIDEAYVDFTDDPVRASALPLARAGRAVVLRTFSKVYGLAGVRVGYLVGPVEVVTALRAIRAPFSINALAQAAAVAALGDQAHWQRVREYTRDGRRRIAEIFHAAGFETVPSAANFVLVLVPDEPGLVAALAAHGVSVRPGSSLGVPGSVRVSVPSPEGLARLERAVSAIAGGSTSIAKETTGHECRRAR